MMNISFPFDSVVFLTIQHIFQLIPLLRPPSPTLMLQYLEEHQISREQILRWNPIVSLPIITILNSINNVMYPTQPYYFDLANRKDLKMNLSPTSDIWLYNDIEKKSLPGLPVMDDDVEGLRLIHKLSEKIFPLDNRLEDAGMKLS